jgi:hypothetical protein
MSSPEVAGRTGPAPAPRLPARAARAAYGYLGPVTIAACLGLAGVFFARTAGAAVPAATAWGRWYGLAGALLLLFLSVYGIRRLAHRSPMGSLVAWYRLHLLLGTVALTLLGCHSGFAFRSPFLAVLQLTFWGTVLTGVLGWVYQTALKRWLVRNEYRPAVLKELEARRAALQEKLDPAAAPALASLEAVRRALLWKFPDWSAWESTTDESLARDATGLSDADREALRELQRTEVLRSYHRLLRGWTTVHLLFTVLAVQMTLWHVATVGLYPR